MMRSSSRQLRHLLTFIFIISVTALLLFQTKLSERNARAANPQGKGGTIKPAPTPRPKVTPRQGTRAGAQPPPRKSKSLPASYTEMVNKVPLEMVLIPAGTFLMGSPDGEGRDDEHPQHQVTVQSFYIGRFEVTQAQYKAVMKEVAFYARGDNLPMDVNWTDAAEFCRRLSRLTGREYRLPSEAEWEYAARAGTNTNYFWGDNIRAACLYANVADQSAKAKHADWATADCWDEYPDIAPVGKFRPNAFGLHDMIGNAWEWCEDLYHSNYEGAPTDGSAWVSYTDEIFLYELRVSRGASWYGYFPGIRSANREKFRPGDRYDAGGFRVVTVARPQ